MTFSTQPYLGHGTRLDSGPSALLVSTGFATEIGQAGHLHSWMGLADLVHVLALRDAGVIPEDVCSKLLTVLLTMLDQDADDMAYDPAHGDVYNSREHLTRSLLGADAGWLHLGRTRREAGRVAFYLATRSSLLDLHRATCDFVEAAITRAVENAQTWWADMTYLQPAQVSTFGHYLLSFGHEAARHLDRIRRAYDACMNLPMATGGVAGTTVPVTRSAYAKRLGVGSSATTSRDAMWSTDVLLEVVFAAVQGTTTVSRLAEDFLVLATAPFGFVTLHDSHARASVYLPQKRNPYALSVIRGGASRLIGRATGVMTSVRTPSAQTDNWIYNYGEVIEAVDAASGLVELASEMLAAAAFDAERMLLLTHDGFTDAPDLAEGLVEAEGLDYRSAHEIVGALTRAAESRGQRSFADADYRELSDRTGTPARSRDAARLVTDRRQQGGAAPPQVRASARRLQRRVAQARGWATDASDASDSVARGIVAEASAIASQA